MAALIVLGVAGVPPDARAENDLASLYGRDALETSRRRLSSSMAGVWREDLGRLLTPKERAVESSLELAMPLVGRHRNPFDFYADETSINFPVLSVKFWNDFSIALAYFERNRCDTGALFDYVGMLRYGQAPDGHYPPPLVAFRIPGDALSDSYVDDASLKTIKSAIFFLMAHELAHVLYRHPGYVGVSARQAQANEAQADAFALEVMRRARTAPFGIVPWFMAAARFEATRADFRDDASYREYLEKRATHPLSADRLAAIARGIRADVEGFVSAENDNSAYRAAIARMADDIDNIAGVLADDGVRLLLDKHSREVTRAELARSCRP